MTTILFPHTYFGNATTRRTRPPVKIAVEDDNRDGCASCAVPEHEHGWQRSEQLGEHLWVEPTEAQWRKRHVNEVARILTKSLVSIIELTHCNTRSSELLQFHHEVQEHAENYIRCHNAMILNGMTAKYPDGLLGDPKLFCDIAKSLVINTYSLAMRFGIDLEHLESAVVRRREPVLVKERVVEENPWIKVGCPVLLTAEERTVYTVLCIKFDILNRLSPDLRAEVGLFQNWCKTIYESGPQNREVPTNPVMDARFYALAE